MTTTPSERFKLLFCGRTMEDAYYYTRSKLDEKAFDVRQEQ